MKNSWIILLWMLLVINGISQNPTYQLIGETVCSGESVVASVRIKNFEMMSSTQFSISWDSVLLEYVEVMDLNPSIINPIFNTHKLSGGKLGFSWIDLSTNGLSLMDESVLFKIKWNSVMDTAALFDLTFISDPVLIESSQNLLQVQSDLVADVVQLLHPFVASQIITPTSANESNGSIVIETDGGQAPYTYLWSDTSTEQNPMNLSIGNYFCTITDNQDCQNVVGPFFVDQQTSIKELSLVENWHILPNPLTDFLNVNIHLFEAKKGNLSIQNILGQVVFKRHFGEQVITQSIDLSSEPPGIYFVVIQVGKERFLQKFIKQ